MDSDRRKRIEDLFEKILDEPPSVWERLLDEVSGGDDGFRLEVQRLLNAHQRAGGVLESTPPSPEALVRPDSGGHTDERIGKYRILEEVGRGGMGIVYRAERADGHFQRIVALKVGPRADPTLGARIVAERQILASLQHPNIARLFDGGVTDDGRPFIVMEYVDGVSIDAYCNQKRLSLRERLQVFQVVLGAVEHAHRNLIVHRDLKPSNILVTAAGEVKLLDFGIAKLLSPAADGSITPEALTDYRAFTPEYASPEQVLGESITTASDVYSLGLVLSELLSGNRPLRPTDQDLASLEGVARARPSEPPSVLVDSSGVGDPGSKWFHTTATNEVAEVRSTTLQRLRRHLRGDLDAVVMKALKRKPGHRYGSVSLLSQDINNHLGDLPVLARRGGRGYRTRKFVKRHRVETLGLALVTVALFAGAGAFAWQARLTARERDRAENAFRQSEEVSGFLIRLFEDSDPLETPGDTVTVSDLLRRGVQRVDALDGEPLVQARMLQVMGRVSQNIGRYDRASDLAREAVHVLETQHPEGHPDLAAALAQLGTALRMGGSYDRANAALFRALDVHRGQEMLDPLGFGYTLEELSRVAVYLGNLTEAEEFAREGVSLREESLGRDASPTLNTLTILGSILRYQGRYKEAEEVYREVLQRRRSLVREDPLALTVDLLQLGDHLSDHGGNIGEVETLYLEALELTRTGGGGVQRNKVWALTSLGSLKERSGDLEEADRLYSEGVETRLRVYGDVHPLVSEALAEYGEFLTRIGKPREGEALLRQAIEVDLQTVGPGHVRYAGTLTGLAESLAAQDRLSEADSAVNLALAIRVSAQGRQVPIVAQTMIHLADLRTRQRRFEDAETLLDDAWAIVQEQPAVGKVSLRVHAAFARLYDAWGRPEEAARHRAMGAGG
jgi:serine/threonine protein kinase/tetratricopeptide (TPR) repeat protein